MVGQHHSFVTPHRHSLADLADLFHYHAWPSLQPFSTFRSSIARTQNIAYCCKRCAQQQKAAWSAIRQVNTSSFAAPSLSAGYRNVVCMSGGDAWQSIQQHNQPRQTRLRTEHFKKSHDVQNVSIIRCRHNV